MPRDGIEPPTRGFSVPASDAPEPLRRKEIDTAAGAPSPVVPRCALALLEAVDEGRPAGDLCRALALAVLASETPGEAPWTAAVEVIEGGPLRIRRAVALAGMILDREAPSSRRSLHT